MLAQENIAFFLAALAEYGVSPHKRFFMLDLWNGNSRPRVVESLAELARVAVAKKFPIGLKVSTFSLEKMPHPLTPEQTKSLNEQLSKMRVVREGGVGVVGGGAAGSSLLKNREPPGIFKRKLAYLVSQKEFPEFERRWTRIQALMRGRAARTKFQSRVLNQAFRDKVAFELRDTEASYVASLKICIDKYMSPLKTGSWNKKLILPASTLKTLFSDLEIIQNVNAVLKQSIDKSMETWGPASQLGNIFVSVMGFLKIYANYVSTADAQLQEYDTLLKTNKLFAQFVEETRATANGMLDIPGYLIMPIQRVPRYFMLLERLAKHTWKDHRDYADLEKSVQGLQAVATHLNEQKRKFENIRSVITFQSSIIGCPHVALPTRRFVMQCELQDTKKKDDWLCVLFNDSLLIAKVEKKKGASTYKFKEQLIFPDVDMTESGTASGAEASGKEKSPEKSSSLPLVEITSKGVSVLKFSPSPEASNLAQQLSAAKHALKSFNDSKLGSNDDTAALAAAIPELVLVGASEQPITAEELLKQRELEKRQLKMQMAEEMKMLKPSSSSSTTSSSPGPSASPLSSSPSNSLEPPTRSASPSKRASAQIAPALRSTASLLKMKAIVEQQINVLDSQFEHEPKSDEYRQLATNLNEELAELDQTLEEVKTGLSPEAREAVNQEESAVRLKVAEEPKTMRSKKKPRKSFFSFFTSSVSGSGRESPTSSSSDTTDTKTSTPLTSTPPSSAKLAPPSAAGKTTPGTSKLKGSGKHAD